jgi:hypothetical protein
MLGLGLSGFGVCIEYQLSSAGVGDLESHDLDFAILVLHRDRLEPRVNVGRGIDGAALCILSRR